MLIEEIIEINGKRFIKHYSNRKKMICQIETGVNYSEAIDVIPCKYTYRETSIDAEVENAEVG